MDATLIVTVQSPQHLQHLLQVISSQATLQRWNLHAADLPETLVSAPAADLPDRSCLSRIEWRMVELAMHGMPRRTIATTLCLSVSSVSTYWARIYSKLGITSRMELLAWYRLAVGSANTGRS